MNNAFFVYSLPRSGSAWLANFLTSRDSFCYHEPTADIPLESLRERLQWRQEGVVGAVDTSSFISPERFTEAVRPDRTAMLLRDPAAIRISSARLGFEFPAYAHQIRMVAALPGVFQIQYEHLHDMGCLRELWAHLIGTPFDDERAAQLVEMNVQRDLQRFLISRPRLTVGA